MQIWMEYQDSEKDYFAFRTAISMVLLLALVIVMPIGVTLLALYYGWPVKEVTLGKMQKTRKNIKTGNILERYMSEEESIEKLETEILLVHRMRIVRAGYTADCQVRYPNGHIGRRKYLLINGYENETGLIAAFERRMTGGGSEGRVQK